MSEAADPQAPAQQPALPWRTLAKDDESLWSDLDRRIVQAIKTVYDPEIHVDVWELGLIYAVRTAEDGHVEADMTLTSPMLGIISFLFIVGLGFDDTTRFIAKIIL